MISVCRASGTTIARLRACMYRRPDLSGIPMELCTAAVTVLHRDGFLHRGRNDAWVVSAETETPDR
jgi:hypothetical protein